MKAQYMLGLGHAAAWDQLQMGNLQCSRATVPAVVVAGWHYITACIAQQGGL